MKIWVYAGAYLTMIAVVATSLFTTNESSQQPSSVSSSPVKTIVESETAAAEQLLNDQDLSTAKADESEPTQEIATTAPTPMVSERDLPASKPDSGQTVGEQTTFLMQPNFGIGVPLDAKLDEPQAVICGIWAFQQFAQRVGFIDPIDPATARVTYPLPAPIWIINALKQAAT